MKLKLTRLYHEDYTLGTLVGDGFKCFTLELAWRDNLRSISAIPAGTYKAFKRVSNKNGNVFQLVDVPNRTFIQVHAGNFTYQTEGCILVGDGVKYLDGDSIPDVIASNAALSRLYRLTDELEIEIV